MSLKQNDRVAESWLEKQLEDWDTQPPKSEPTDEDIINFLTQ